MTLQARQYSPSILLTGRYSCALIVANERIEKLLNNSGIQTDGGMDALGDKLNYKPLG